MRTLNPIHRRRGLFGLAGQKGGRNLILGCALLGAAIVSAAAGERITLDKLLLQGRYGAAGYGGVKWRASGKYLRWTGARDGRPGRDLEEIDPETGKGTLFLPSQRLIPGRDSGLLSVERYVLNRRESRLLIYTNSKRVWRQNTRGDYWVLDLTSGELRKLGGDAPPSTLMFAEFGPDGRRVAYVRAHNLYVEDAVTGKITPLTQDGSEHVINGTFDWVYEEELSLRKGFQWSPDGSRIAFWQLNTEGVGVFYLINNTAGLYPKLIPIPYPKSGTRNSAARIGVVPAEGGKPVWIRLPGDPREHYPARLMWFPDGKRLLIQYLNRRQNTNAIYVADATTGQARKLTEDVDPAWTEVCDDWQWLEDGKAFLWKSERDGWARLYRIDARTGKWRRITRGDYDVIKTVRVDEKAGWIYFIASPDNPTERYLYRVRCRGGQAQRVTPKNQRGTHSYNISPDGRWAFHTWSTFDMPPKTELIELPAHRTVRTLVENKSLQKRLAELEPKLETGFFRVETEPGVKLDGWYIRPAQRRPGAKYPALFHVYGEPAGQTVLNRWGGRNAMWHRMLAQEGYVVLSVDNRGTPAPRGREWRKCIYGKMGVLASRDQARAVRAILHKWPWLDRDRIAVWGWSGGGSMTLNAMFRYPDLYKTGMAVAPVPNMRLYDTIYQERYMGLPDDNPEGYRLGSPITFAKNLRGDLLLVHGTGDDNVHYQGMEALINELIAWNKPFTMMAYPGRSHSIYEGPNTRRHLFGLLTRFLEEHCPPGPR